MNQNSKTIYRSGIDLWLGSMIFLALIAIFVVSLGVSWWFTLLYGGGLTILIAIAMFGCWYEIDGNQLTVYQFFRPHRFPIDKIKEVKKTIGYLATAGMSRHRVSIKFVDRSVMKSSMPLEISPKDRDAFIARLCQVNPEIIAR
ncbi:MAG: PH domain-containing protein [Muribaculaceae bacterium]|nr:PH domain-containing protein [Muribaculaceae bacterium]